MLLLFVYRQTGVDRTIVKRGVILSEAQRS